MSQVTVITYTICKLICKYILDSLIIFKLKIYNLGQMVDPLWSAFNVVVEKSSIHGQEGSIHYLPSNYPLIILSGYVNK